MNWGKPFRGRHAIESVFCAILIGVGEFEPTDALLPMACPEPMYGVAGIFILGVGTYASVQSIINSYATGSIKSPFSCANNGF